MGSGGRGGNNLPFESGPLLSSSKSVNDGRDDSAEGAESTDKDARAEQTEVAAIMVPTKKKLKLN